ncbi:MAG: hypothetical protein U5K30_06900 [Acidimicrobiales bacterium]|nr:hypothetical protein [Acidimicrobiales bacterium]
MFVESTDGFGSPEAATVIGNVDAEVTEITALWLNLPTILGWKGKAEADGRRRCGRGMAFHARTEA